MTLKFVNGKSQQNQTCVATTNSRPRLVCYTTVRFEENAYKFFFRGQTRSVTGDGKLRITPNSFELLLTPCDWQKNTATFAPTNQKQKHVPLLNTLSRASRQLDAFGPSLTCSHAVFTNLIVMYSEQVIMKIL